MDLIRPSKILFSNRKTVALQITEKGEFVVRAPKKTNLEQINQFVEKKQSWLIKTLQKISTKLARAETEKLELTDSELKDYKNKAKKLFAERLDCYSKLTGLGFESFKLSSAKSKWGSCSSKNNINLNWRLVLAPVEVLDYVIIHELCHVKEKNHSKKFWDLVANFMPNYKERKQWLKEYGALLY